MTLKTKKILVIIGEVATIGLIWVGISKDPVLAKRILTAIGAWQLGRFIGLIGNALIKQYEVEEKEKTKVDDGYNG